MTFETSTGAAFSRIPAGATCAPPMRDVSVIGRGRWWRLTMFRFSTMTRRSVGRASMTRPCLPRSLPERICTRSPFFTRIVVAISRAPFLQDLGRERDDLHEVSLAQLARDRPEDPRPTRVVLVVDDDGRVLVEAD